MAAAATPAKAAKAAVAPPPVETPKREAQVRLSTPRRLSWRRQNTLHLVTVLLRQ